jgi:hypothetical protein
VTYTVVTCSISQSTDSFLCDARTTNHAARRIENLQPKAVCRGDRKEDVDDASVSMEHYEVLNENMKIMKHINQKSRNWSHAVSYTKNASWTTRSLRFRERLHSVGLKFASARWRFQNCVHKSCEGMWLLKTSILLSLKKLILELRMQLYR